MYLATGFINKFLCKYVTCLIAFIPKDSPFSHFCIPFGSLFPHSLCFSFVTCTRLSLGVYTRSRTYRQGITRCLSP